MGFLQAIAQFGLVGALAWLLRGRSRGAQADQTCRGAELPVPPMEYRAAHPDFVSSRVCATAGGPASANHSGRSRGQSGWERFVPPPARLVAAPIEAPREHISFDGRISLNLRSFKDVRFGTSGRAFVGVVAFLNLGVAWMALDSYYRSHDMREVFAVLAFFGVLFLLPANAFVLFQGMLTSTIDPMVRGWFGIHGCRNLDAPRKELTASYGLSLDDVGVTQRLDWGYLIRIPWAMLTKRPFRARRGYVFGIDEQRLKTAFDLFAGCNGLRKASEAPTQCLYLPFEVTREHPELLGQVRERIAWWHGKLKKGNEATVASIVHMLDDWTLDDSAFEVYMDGTWMSLGEGMKRASGGQYD